MCSGEMTRAKEQFDELQKYIMSIGVSDDPENNRSYLMQVLHKAQHIFGYLPEIVQKYISLALKIPHAEIYGVISFYSFFSTTPKGEYVISVCTGTACYVNGASEVLEALREELHVSLGGTTSDGKFTLDTLRCVGACGIAPVVLVNGKAYGKVDAHQAKKILKKYSTLALQKEKEAKEAQATDEVLSEQESKETENA